MDSQDNPYSGLVELMQKEGAANNPIPYLLGIVISASPLIIQVNKIQIYRRDVLINTALLGGSQAGVTLSGEAELDGAEKKDFKLTGGTLTTGGGLVAGDQVVLLTLDQQQYILLCKVR